MMSASEANELVFKGKFCEMQTECLAMHSEMLPDLVGVVLKAKSSTTLENQLIESVRKLLKVESELGVAKSVLLEEQHTALSKPKGSLLMSSIVVKREGKAGLAFD